jgi:hypothetical protein
VLVTFIIGALAGPAGIATLQPSCISSSCQHTSASANTVPDTSLLTLTVIVMVVLWAYVSTYALVNTGDEENATMVTNKEE